MSFQDKDAAARGPDAFRLSVVVPVFNERYVVEASLRRLGTDYVDLLQLHDPPPATLRDGDALATLERLYAEHAEFGRAYVLGLLPGIALMGILILRPRIIERIRQSAVPIAIFGLLLPIATAFIGEVDETGARLALRQLPIEPGSRSAWASPSRSSGSQCARTRSGSSR